MNYQDLKMKTVSELYDSLTNMKKELLGLRIQKTVGQLASPIQIRNTRRQIAQTLTRLNQLKQKNEVQ